MMLKHASSCTIPSGSRSYPNSLHVTAHSKPRSWLTSCSTLPAPGPCRLCPAQSNATSLQYKQLAHSSFCCRATGVQLEGRSSKAADCLAPTDVAHALLRRWLGLGSDAELPVVQEIGPVRDTVCAITVCATSISCGPRQHILLAFVLTDASTADSSAGNPDSHSKRDARPGSAGFTVANLNGPVLHWGCVAGRGDRWQPPPAGWSTWPDVSNDARGGAWQTPFTEQQLPQGGHALTMLLQVPCEGPLRTGGLSFLLKVGNSWLGNAATYSDFFFSTAGLPNVLSDDIIAHQHETTTTGDGREFNNLVGPEAVLDLKRLATMPVQTSHHSHKGSSNKREKSKRGWQQDGHQGQHHHHAQEPELPNAGRRDREPANDDTQVCKLSAADLRGAAAAQLSSWAQQHPDLEVPAGGLEIQNHEYSIKGHPTTPFVMASTVLWATGTSSQLVSSSSSAGGNPSGGSSRQPVLLLAAMGDVGLSGTRVPGLVLHWTAVPSAATPDAAAASLAADGSPHVLAVPEGWRTLPDLSWDAGSGYWDTPMTRYLLQPVPTAPGSSRASQGAQPVLGRPVSPSRAVAQSAEAAAANMYLVLMRLPLQGVLRTGGLRFVLRTSRRQWVTNSSTGGPFFLDTSQYAKQLGLVQPPPAPSMASITGAAVTPAGIGAAPSTAASAPAERQQQQQSSALTLDEVSRKALAAAGLSQEDIDAFAASMPHPLLSQSSNSHATLEQSSSSAGAGSVRGAAPVLSGNSKTQQILDGLYDALGSADADMAAHIEAHSAKGRGPSHGSSSNGGIGAAPAWPAEQLQSEMSEEQQLFGPGGVSKFLRDFEPELADASLLLRQASTDGAASSDHVDVPGLAPHQDLLAHIAQLEHKARRSLMHRYGIAAELVNELLPDLKAAAASAPTSLLWPPSTGATAAHGWPHVSPHGDAALLKGHRALAGLVAVAVWLRLSSLRLLTWNHNYNVKPREISAALDNLGTSLLQVLEVAPQLSGVVLLALASAGRGGEGDMGQRIRDEILAIQQRNGCKGGMMEEWHQKLHNNSSADDVVICQALLDYIAAGQQQQAYWDSLAAAGITADRLASYDRPIRSPPPVFKPEQLEQLTADLVAYRRTLAAVHSGADLSAAIDGVLGYDAGECKGKRVKVEPLAAVVTPRLQQLLKAVLAMVHASNGSSIAAGGGRPPSPGGGKVAAMMEVERCLKLQGLVVTARCCLLPAIKGGNSACQGRLRDVLFLDLALELTGRNALESSLTAVRAAAPSTLLGGLLALLQQPLAAACLSALPGQGDNAALVAMYKQLRQLSSECPGLDPAAKARHALSLLERLRACLAAAGASAEAVLQPTATALAGALGLTGRPEAQGTVDVLAEEVVRGSAAAALSLLLNAVEPSLRRLAGVGAWSVVSRLPSRTSGTLSSITPGLAQVEQAAISSGSTILVLQRLDGAEEVPVGVVGVVVLGQCPDVLSHAAVRARNCRIPVVAVPSSEEALVSQVVGLAGRQVTLTINGDDVTLAESAATRFASQLSAASQAAGADSDTQLVAGQHQRQQRQQQGLHGPKALCGSWVVTVDHFQAGVVGAKALSSAQLGRAAGVEGRPRAQQHSRLLPDWLNIPQSVALPQGCYEAVLQAPDNAEVGGQLQQLAGQVAQHCSSTAGVGQEAQRVLQQIRSLVQQLKAPADLQHQLKQQLSVLVATAASGSSSPGPAPGCDWDAVWMAIKGVWASQWNDRAVAALGKAHLPLHQLRMGVLLQPLLPARYSWVAHTVNPASGSSSEVVVQLVVGLGEVLVGNHPGRPLSGVIKREALTAALEQQHQQGGAGGLRSQVSQTAGAGALKAPAPPEGLDVLTAVDVASYPGKNAAVVPPGLCLPCSAAGTGLPAATSSSTRAGQVVIMARSDSNAEDLPGFAGAGLFDSLPSCPSETVLLDYTGEPLVWDKAAAAEVLWQCALAAVTAEQLMQPEGAGQDQFQGLDVEGCVTEDGGVWLLQARPQV